MNDVAHKGPAPALTGVQTHADHGEDLILKVMFDVLGIAKPSYLDIGAFDPWHINNTVMLYAAGASGINVEANPALMARLTKYRARDINLNCAIGPERLDKRTLYIDDNPGLSTFHRDLIEVYKGEMDVPVWTIPDILAGHRGGKWPDLLTIDIEGEDVAVLDSCLPASGDRPMVVVVEWLRLTTDFSAEWLKLMPTRGYHLFFRTRSNMIWVTQETLDRLLAIEP